MTIHAQQLPRSPRELALALGGWRLALGVAVLVVALLALWLWLVSGWQPRYSRQVVLGLSSGSLYALLALAIVLIYRSTAVVNFAQGEMATFSTFIAWSLLQSFGDDTASVWLVTGLTLVIGFAIGAALELAVIRRIEHRSALNAAVIAIAIFLVFNSVTGWLYGGEPKPVPSLFGTGTATLGDVTVSVHTLGTIGASIAVMAAMFLVFRFTQLGLAMRAAAEDPVTARLMGVRVGRMLTLGWGLSSAVGALAGVLIAHSLNLSPILMFDILLFALAAAVLGGITSPAGAVLGGLLVGVAQNVLGVTDALGGTQLRLFWAFAFILLVLVARPSGMLAHGRARRL